ncbi:hypothetical protein NECAME_13226 [Necator americanus]|uniref:Uncharacterized protein n=1 Tax=Necator americanus TaxID=51031 RepID=W2SZD4_NECAM|nr:hypothetical protein NECAME_13226 [Necator americanus]ETN74067.1 hypothetical protein NECAME_13226 [Necator americanus]
MSDECAVVSDRILAVIWRAPADCSTRVANLQVRGASFKIPSSYGKRAYKDNLLSHPAQKSAKVASHEPPSLLDLTFPEQSLPEKMSKKEFLRDSYGSRSTTQVSETWRTNEKPLPPKSAEPRYGKSEEERKMRFTRDSDIPNSRKGRNYDAVMNVVMGSINESPQQKERNSLIDGNTLNKLNKEDFSGYNGGSPNAEFLKRHSSDSFNTLSSPSSLGGKDPYKKELTLRSEIPTKEANRWESWRNLSTNQAKSSSKPVVRKDSPTVVTDSWRTSTPNAPKTESWRNTGKNTIESSMKTRMMEINRRPYDNNKSTGIPQLMSLSFDRPDSFGRKGYVGREGNRNVRR